MELKQVMNPTYFTVIGDCQTMTGQFLGPYYNLDPNLFTDNVDNYLETLGIFSEKNRSNIILPEIWMEQILLHT